MDTVGTGGPTLRVDMLGTEYAYVAAPWTFSSFLYFYSKGTRVSQAFFRSTVKIKDTVYVEFVDSSTVDTLWILVAMWTLFALRLHVPLMGTCGTWNIAKAV